MPGAPRPGSAGGRASGPATEAPADRRCGRARHVHVAARARSAPGVFESIEFLIETPGEDIPHLNIRPHYKHRGIAKQFEGRSGPRRCPGRRTRRGHQHRRARAGLREAVERLSGDRVAGAGPGAPRGSRRARADGQPFRCDDAARRCGRAGRGDEPVRLAQGSRHAVWCPGVVRQQVRARSRASRAGCPRLPLLTITPCAASWRSSWAIASALTWRPCMSSASFMDRIRGTGPLPIAAGGSARRARAHRQRQQLRHRRTPGRPYDGYLDPAAGRCRSHARPRATHWPGRGCAGRRSTPRSQLVDAVRRPALTSARGAPSPCR